jgi:hypothetical protein
VSHTCNHHKCKWNDATIHAYFQSHIKWTYVKHEFGTYPNCGYNEFLEKAKMDEMMLQIWIDLSSCHAPGINPILILDAFWIHVMEVIVNQINPLGLRLFTSLWTACIHVGPLILESTHPSKAECEKMVVFDVGRRWDCQWSHKGVIMKIGRRMSCWSLHNA